MLNRVKGSYWEAWQDCLPLAIRAGYYAVAGLGVRQATWLW